MARADVGVGWSFQKDKNKVGGRVLQGAALSIGSRTKHTASFVETKYVQSVGIKG